MTDYQEILRLHSMGISQRNIAYSCHASKTTVSRVLKKAKELGIAQPLDENQTNGVLAKLFSTPSGKPEEASPKPDFSYVRKELMRSAIIKKLNALNRKEFQKKEGSRSSLFRNEEMPFLLPLPTSPYELAVWKQATVQFNYHISVEGMLYSVSAL